MDVGAITISGLVSDLDTDQIITQLAQIRRRPVEMLTERRSTYTQNLTTFQQLTAKVLGLSTAIAGLRSGDAFEQVSVSSSDSSSVLATGVAGAAVGSYDIQVSRLAQNHKISSSSFVAGDEALGLSGDIIVGGEVITIAASDTLEDVRDAINTAGAGATASILTVSENDHRLLISSLTSGAAGALDLVDANNGDLLESLGLQTSSTSVKHSITDGAASDVFSDKLTAVGSVLGLTDTVAGTVLINGSGVDIDLSADSLADIAAAIDAVDGVSASVAADDDGYRLEIVGDSGTPVFSDDGNVLVTLGVLEKAVADEVDAAQDAQFTIDGVSMTRSSNAVDDAIEGVQLQLLAPTDGSDVRVDVSWDQDAAVDEVSQFVDAYNDIVSFINSNRQFDAETGESGPFLGNLAVMNFEQSLRSQVTEIVDTLGGDLVLASQIGITTGRHGELVFDSTDFRSALSADPAGAKRLFGQAHEETSEYVQFQSATSATQDSGPDGWTVHITQAAAQATALSAELASGIAVDETLTIGGVDVALTAGMSLQDAADRLNAMFTAQKMELQAGVVGDRLQIRHELWGASYGVVITSSLDDGAGGTDLGGATAGMAQNYVGSDVAGTIGGMSCTGRGRLLTADEGTDAEGLTLLVTAEDTGDAGVVRFSKGIAARLSDFVLAATDTENGILSRAADSISSEIDAIDERIEDMNAEVDRYIAKLQSDFAMMESRMSRSKSLLDWMSMQIQYLPGMNGSQDNK
ncbi:MAG: flagellar filament capping protein FliD [Armatimonadetes bacterium]|nr:flagellar filament capping protein FliD [Armatimonadota bacterium]